MRVILTGTVLVVFALFAGTLWWVYERGVQRGTENVAPVIAAEEGPIKSRPADPGGLDVPYRDRLVYGRIGESPSYEDLTERLMPPPEEPVVRVQPAEPDAGAPPDNGEQALPSAALPPPPAARQPDGGDGLARSPEQAPRPRPAPDVATEQGEAPSGEATPGPALPVRKPNLGQRSTPESATPPPATAAVSPRPAATAPASGGGYRLQLAAMRSPEAAADAWARLAARHPDVLRGLDLVIERADLGSGKGIYYRVQASAYDTEAPASRACAILKERGVGCLVVRR